MKSVVMVRLSSREQLKRGLVCSGFCICENNWDSAALTKVKVWALWDAVAIADELIAEGDLRYSKLASALPLKIHPVMLKKRICSLICAPSPQNTLQTFLLPSRKTP